MYSAVAQCFNSLGPIPSQPLDFVGSSDERASNTSVSDNDILHRQDGGRGRVPMSGRENKLLVKTEWKKVFFQCQRLH